MQTEMQSKKACIILYGQRTNKLRLKKYKEIFDQLYTCIACIVMWTRYWDSNKSETIRFILCCLYFRQTFSLYYYWI